MSSVSCQHFFYIFFNFIQPNLCCLSKKIRLTQKRIYHIIIFFLRQVLFYIFLHVFYTISDIAIISSFLTPQYQSKEWTSHDWSHMLPDALGVRLNIGGYACNLGAQLCAFPMPDMAGSHITGSPLYICLYLCCF